MKKLLPMPALAVDQQCIRTYRAGRTIPDRWRRADSVRRLMKLVSTHIDQSVNIPALSMCQTRDNKIGKEQNDSEAV
jgi:hypothetical protein